MKIKTLVIDDDADSRLVLSSFIRNNCPQLVVSGEAGSIEESIYHITNEPPDLLLLDISLPDGTAFDLLAKPFEKEFEIIFITAYDKYAVEAFKFSAIDYLLKPIAFTQLTEALRKVVERIEDKYFKKHWVTLTHNLRYKNPYDKRLSIAIGNDYIFVDVKDIIRLESHSNYTHFYLPNNKKLVASHTLGYYEDILPAEYFCRIHNSHIINIEFIDRYTKEGVGGTITLKDGTELSVSQRKKEVVLNLLIKNT